MKRARARKNVNPVDVIEAAYELQSTEREWLTGIAEAIRPLIEGGRGISAYTFDAAVPMKQWFRNEVTLDMSRRQLELQRAFQIAGAEDARTMHMHPEPLGALLQESRRAGLGNLLDKPDLVQRFKEMGIRDYIAFRTIEPGGRGIVINAGQVEVCSFDARTLRLWARVAAHVAAGRRLRATLGSATVEAVLHPSGKLEHAEGEAKTPNARNALREAVSQQELGRGRRRRDAPELATEAWTALVSGRWSLVDRYERGGRRYIVARRNEHALPDPRALTPRERAVVHLAALGKTNKLIAYELGLSTSTVATYVGAAIGKLGVKSRVELIQLARQLGH